MRVRPPRRCSPSSARVGPATGPGERSLARPLLARLESDWLLLADHGFYSFADWCTADDLRTSRARFP